MLVFCLFFSLSVIADSNEDWGEKPVITHLHEISKDKIALEWEGSADLYQIFVDGKNVTTSNTAGTLGADISLYIGNIVLYEAESFPLLYPMMRMKFYLDEANSSDLDNIGIRKVGAVIQYQ